MTYAKQIVINCHNYHLSMVSLNQDHWDRFQMDGCSWLCVKTIQGSKMYVFVFFSINYRRKTMKREVFCCSLFLYQTKISSSCTLGLGMKVIIASCSYLLRMM